MERKALEEYLDPTSSDFPVVFCYPGFPLQQVPSLKGFLIREVSSMTFYLEKKVLNSL